MVQLFRLGNNKKGELKLEEWQNIRIQGITEINKVVAVFEVWNNEKIPCGKFKVKILESSSGNFIGVPNIAVKNSEDKTPEWTSGMGNSVSEALKDTIKYLMESINECSVLSDSDFEWAAPEDF